MRIAGLDHAFIDKRIRISINKAVFQRSVVDHTSTPTDARRPLVAQRVARIDRYQCNAADVSLIGDHTCARRAIDDDRVASHRES